MPLSELDVDSDDWSSASLPYMEQERNVMDEALQEILAEIRAAQEQSPIVSMSPAARKEYVSNVLIVKVRNKATSPLSLSYLLARRLLPLFLLLSISFFVWMLYLCIFIAHFA